MPDEVIARSYVELLPRNAQNFGRQVASTVKQTMGQATGQIRAQTQQISQQVRTQHQAVTRSAQQAGQAQTRVAQQTARAQQAAARQTRDAQGRAIKGAEDDSRKSNDRQRRDSTRTTATIGKNFGGLRASIGKSFSGLGGLLAGAFAGVAVGGFIKSAVSAASDLNETVSKSTVIFGQEALPALEKFARGADKSLGQSQQQALDAAATFGIFGKSAGLSGQNLVGFSTKLTALAGDMASFSNTSPEEAITAIGAALRGETEPIRRYGVLIDDASTRQEALRLGIVKTTKDALTPQQRVLAVQSLIMKQTGAAQGDFARTSGGLANQQRILSAQFANAKASLGAGFLPVALKFVGFLNTSAIPAFREFAGGIRAFAAAFKAGDGDITSSGFPGFMERVAFFARQAFDYFRANVLPVLREFGQYLVGVVVPAVARFAANLATTLWPILSTVFNFVATQVIPRLREFGAQMAPIVARGAEMASALSKNRDILVPFVATVLAGYAAFKAFSIVSTIIGFIRGLTISWAALNAVMAANVVGIVIIAVAALVTGLIYAYRHSERFRVIVQAAWAGISAAAQAAWPVIKAAIEVIIAVFNLWWKYYAHPILTGFVALLKVVWGQVQAFGRIVVGVFNALKGPIVTALAFLTRVFLDWVGNLLAGAAKALGWVPGVGGKLRKASAAFNKFKDDTNAAMGKLKDQTINVTPKLKNVVATVGGITRTVPLNTIGSFGRAATGGPIRGPGTTTSDSIPTMLSTEEHVLSAREVRGLGGHGAVAQMRASARSGQFGLARGGTTAANVSPHVPSARGRGVWANEIAAHAVQAARPAAVAAATGLANQMAAAMTAQSGGATTWTGGGDLVPHLFRGKKLNGRTIKMLLAAERILGAMFHIIQGSYHPGYRASGGTHDRGGVMDTDGPRGWTAAVNALRRVGFAAWHRTPAQGFPHHIHSVALGDPTASPQAKNQMASFRRGGNGLGGAAAGAWKLLRDQVLMVHKGEMVVPRNQADELRQLFANSGRIRPTPATGRGRGNNDGYTRLHPDDLAVLLAVAGRPIVLNGRRLDEGLSEEALNRRR